nr:DivIVA domain-containing protein [Arthrobacter gengyunqii]
MLPDQVRPDDVGKLRFSVAFRGYRMDQVDAVLARLESVLAERDAALEKRSPRDPGAPA